MAILREMTWCEERKGSLIYSMDCVMPFFMLSKWVYIVSAVLQYSAGLVTILYSSGNLLLYTFFTERYNE